MLIVLLGVLQIDLLDELEVVVNISTYELIFPIFYISLCKLFFEGIFHIHVCVLKLDQIMESKRPLVLFSDLLFLAIVILIKIHYNRAVDTRDLLF